MVVFHKWGAGVDPDLPAIERAHDEFLVTADGEELVDAAAGAAVVNLGHSPPGIADVAAEQTDRVGYVSTSHFTHEPLESLTERLTELTPPGLNAAFYVNSGSEATETAIKLAREYHLSRGRPEKRTVVGRWQGYHGATLGALSVSGNTTRRRGYEPLLVDTAHVPPAYPYRWDYAGTPEEQARAAARELETVVRQEGAETVAAFVAEPVSGSSIPAARPHPAYFEEVRRICDEYDVLFVADEIMTGFGRTGSTFAVDAAGVVPDLLTVGKGLSSGYAPISATVVRDDVAAAFDAEEDGAFAHGHTYSGNPISCAVADRVLDEYTPELLAQAESRGDLLRSELEPLRDHPAVGDLRQAGLMIGVEFVADRETKAPFDPDLAVHERVYEAALDGGVYVYPGHGCVDGVAGDHVMLTPPFTVSEESVRTIAATLIDAVETVADGLPADAAWSGAR